ncbi:endo-1,3-alpha-glucanase family glycosylhydrolase [Streptomyces sp. BI20]|uniref:glycoside hydrolase family 71 protein n=1 Tax=Streptomyces sp. BI20 TaxID=3403460 RepID=UPI003C73B00A
MATGRDTGPTRHRRGGRGAKGARRARRSRLPLLAGLAALLVVAGVLAGLVWEPLTAGAGESRRPVAAPGAAVERAPDTEPDPDGNARPDPGEEDANPDPAPSAEPPRASAEDAAAEAERERRAETEARTRPGVLPFDLPDPAALRAAGRERGGKLVFAHYFTPYPLSLDNASADGDYYTRNYLTARGEDGKHARYGGLLRDRPLPVVPHAGGDWEGANLRQEIRTARAAGLDGFTLDLLSLTGKNRERSEELMAAAQAVDPAFRIMLMPDMTSLRTDDPKVLAKALAELGRSPAAHRLADGRLVVSPFKAEAKGVDWWRAVIAELRTRYGTQVALVPLFLNFDAHHAAFAPISFGFSEWGSRSYTGQEGAARDVSRARALGKIWMQPVSVQDARPNQGVYDEAGNTATLRETWTRAIEDGADWVQITTWNDYSEGSHVSPSLHNGHVYLDISSYYLTWFKTGEAPRITRDVLYLTSRIQFAGAAGPLGQPLLMSLRKGSAPARDTVEVLSFLTAPAQVSVTTGGARDTARTEAGLRARTVPLRAGTSEAALTRDGRPGPRVDLPWPVERASTTQDLQYYAAGSARD